MYMYTCIYIVHVVVHMNNSGMLIHVIMSNIILFD